MDANFQELLVLFLVQYFCFLFSLSVHEAAHALVADRCGDPTGRLLGRITLNPVKHIDPVGTVIMPALMFFVSAGFLFGWAKPVPFNPRNLRHFQRDPALIAVAGPVSNLLIAIVTLLLLRVGLIGLGPERMQDTFLLAIGLVLIKINLLLMLFNMIPVPPLDGGHVLRSILPESGRQMMDSIGPFGILIAMFVGSRYLHIPLTYLFDKVEMLLVWGIPVA